MTRDIVSSPPVILSIPRDGHDEQSGLIPFPGAHEFRRPGTPRSNTGRGLRPAEGPVSAAETETLPPATLSAAGTDGANAARQ
jgi:hypothetical protein